MEETTDEIDTFLFLCHHKKPWKAQLKLQEARVIQVELVKEALGSDVPTFPRGKFHVIISTHTLQVALFEFESTAGCRTTSSKLHEYLLFPKPNYKDIVQNPEMRVGYKFLYSRDVEYKVVEKKVHITPTGEIIRRDDREKLFKTEKTRALCKQLETVFPTYKIYMPHPMRTNTFCPFTGGGDIEIFYHTTAAVVEACHGNEEQEEVNITPPKKGEQRSVVLENKGNRSQQEPVEVILQLQADMIMTCGKLLQKIIKNNADEARNVRCLIVYGVQIGLTYPVKLLKVTMDFDAEMVQFHELFNSYIDPNAGAYIDMALQYVFQALGQQAPDQQDQAQQQ